MFNDFISIEYNKSVYPKFLRFYPYDSVTQPCDPRESTEVGCNEDFRKIIENIKSISRIITEKLSHTSNMVNIGKILERAPKKIRNQSVTFDKIIAALLAIKENNMHKFSQLHTDIESIDKPGEDSFIRPPFDKEKLANDTLLSLHEFGMDFYTKEQVIEKIDQLIASGNQEPTIQQVIDSFF